MASAAAVLIHLHPERAAATAAASHRTNCLLVCIHFLHHRLGRRRRQFSANHRKACNPELKAMIDDLRKAKVRGSWDGVTRSGDSKVIDIRGFFK